LVCATSSEGLLVCNVVATAVEVLNGVTWSDALDDTFRRAYERDAQLSWQYFCSVTGFLRHFPGIYLGSLQSVFYTPTALYSYIRILLGREIDFSCNGTRV